METGEVGREELKGGDRELIALSSLELGTEATPTDTYIHRQTDRQAV